MSYRTVAFAAVVAALLLQALSPPGYMAGSLTNGWPVVLCPDGLPGDFLGHEHHQHDAQSAHDVALDGHCPLGSVQESGAVLALGHAPTQSRPISSLIPLRLQSAVFAAYSLKPPSRGPPQLV